MNCEGHHRRSTRRRPEARYLVRHRMDSPEKARRLCGIHAGPYLRDPGDAGGDRWIVEELPRSVPGLPSSFPVGSVSPDQPVAEERHG